MKNRTLRQSAAAFAVGIAATLAVTAPVQAGVIMSSSDLPPIGNDVFSLPTGYLSPAAVHAMFSGPGLAIVLSDVIHQPFSLISRVPDGFGNEIETFNSTLDAMGSINAGPLFPIHATGPVMTRVDYGGGGPVGTFATEMLSLSLTGPGPLMIRESPTLQSTGQTQVQIVPGGFQIDSFFDVFTELSLDGGATWMPNVGAATHVELQPIPEPTGAVTGLLCLGLAALRRRRAAPCS